MSNILDFIGGSGGAVSTLELLDIMKNGTATEEMYNDLAYRKDEYCEYFKSPAIFRALYTDNTWAKVFFEQSQELKKQAMSVCFEGAVTYDINKQVDTVTITTVANSTLYTITINNTGYNYTSDIDATNEEIVAGLIAAINAGIHPVTASGTTTVILTADAGESFTTTVTANMNVVSAPNDFINDYRAFIKTIGSHPKDYGSIYSFISDVGDVFDTYNKSVIFNKPVLKTLSTDVNFNATHEYIVSEAGLSLVTYPTFSDIAASTVAMTAVAASTTAMTAIAASTVAMTAIAASTVAMTAIAASTVAMTAMMASQIARVTLFNSLTAQTAIRNSTTALTYLDTLKTIITTDGIAANAYALVTSRNCFVTYMASGGYTNQTVNACRYYKHIGDGITATTMVGAQNTPNLNNRFFTSLEMYLYNNVDFYTRTAHVIFFD